MKAAATLESYTSPREDIIKVIKNEPSVILDIGCSDGSLGSTLKTFYKNAQVHGVDYDQEFVKIARSRLDSVTQADLNDLDPTRLPKGVDLIIFADVLEHTIQPNEVLKKIVDHCSSAAATIVVSVPNVQHITVIKNLLFGVWPERDRGIFDRTHLRWFTLRTLRELAASNGCEIQSIERNFRLVDRPDSKWNRAARLFKYLPLKDFFTYQYIISLKPHQTSISVKINE